MRAQVFRQQLQNGLFQLLQTPDTLEQGLRRSRKESGTVNSVILSHRVNSKLNGNYVK